MDWKRTQKSMARGAGEYQAGGMSASALRALSSFVADVRAKARDVDDPSPLLGNLLDLARELIPDASAAVLALGGEGHCSSEELVRVVIGSSREAAEPLRVDFADAWSASRVPALEGLLGLLSGPGDESEKRLWGHSLGEDGAGSSIVFVASVPELLVEAPTAVDLLAIACGAVEDAAERRGARERLERLEDRMLERRAESLQEQRQLESTASARQNLLIGLAHEVQLPLRAIAGFTRRLAETRLSAEQAGMLDSIRSSEDVLADILEDWLAGSSIRAGFRSAAVRPLQLERIVDQVIMLVSATEEAAGLDLRKDYVPGTPRWFYGDEGAIREVLLNLIGNAVRFTTNGFVEVRVDCEDMGSEFARMCIAIEDSGPGMTDVRMERLFEETGQLDSESAAYADEVGIGLPITRQLLERMGGDVGATSLPGEGSTFFVTLPLPLAPAEES